jgi:predicted ester cyclase
MSSEKNKQFYRKVIEQNSNLNLQNFDQFLDTHYTLDFVQHSFGSQGSDMDLPAFRAAGGQWLQDYHDLHYFVDEILAEGDKVFARGHVDAKTNTGEKESWVYFSIARIAGNKVAEEWQLAAQVFEATKDAA